MSKIKVEFNAGPGAYDTTVNYMHCVVEKDGEAIELHHEIEIPDDGEEDPSRYDDEHYPILKAEIIKQAKENGIDPETLEFWWD